MSESMPLDEYLAKGGVLSSPENVSGRYRGELMRLMAIFVDSELAGAAGFADAINKAPGIRERVAAARIVADKLEHADRVLKIMGSFGADVTRYVSHHPWSSRVERTENIGTTRPALDMRLSVFNYPLEGWIDAVVMNVLMSKAVDIQLSELARVSYQPLAEAFREIVPGERRHGELGLSGLKRILELPENKPAVLDAVGYWKPRVAACFGTIGSERYEALRRLGLRHRPNDALLADWTKSMAEIYRALALT